nr:hypothetical protein [Tanacetum cinerariifolium]
GDIEADARVFKRWEGGVEEGVIRRGGGCHRTDVLGAREYKLNAMFGKEGVKSVVIELSAMITLEAFAFELERVEERLMDDYFDDQLGANNDINVLDSSPLFDDLLDDIAHVAPFVLSVDLNEPKDSSKTDKAAQNGRTLKSLPLLISGLHQHLVCLTLVDMYHQLMLGLPSLNVDADVLEMSKYVKDYKIILVNVEHGSSIVDTSMFDRSPDVNRNPASSVARPIVVESSADPFNGLDEILGDYANTRNESTWKQMVVHVGISFIAEDFSFGKFKEVEVEADTEPEEEESDTEGNYTSGSDSEDLDYDPKHDDVIGAVDVQEDDLDVIDYDSFGSDLDDGINSERIIQLRELRRTCKQKNKGLNKYYFYLWKQFASKEIMKGRVKKHSVKTRRQLILKVRTLIEDHTCIQSREIKACTSRFLADHVIKSLATNPDIPVMLVQDQMKKQFKVEVSKIKAFRAKKIASDIMTSSYREHYSLLREYAQELINQNPGTTVWIGVQQEPTSESLIRIFRRVYMCLGALKQGFRACGREILRLDGCFMSGPYPGQILTAVGVDANNVIYLVAYAIVEAIKEYLMKRIVVVQKVLAKTVGPLTSFVTKMFDGIKKGYRELTGIPCKHAVAAIYNMYENSIGVSIPEQWVHAAYKLETWAHVYSFKKGCRGQGGGSSQAGARNVSSQVAGSRKVSGQAAGARNVSGQAAGVRKASSQPSAAQSLAN